MNERTPGPWHASRKCVYVSDIRNRVICEMTDRATREADAQLIAAAPDLLAALHLLVPSCESLAEPMIADPEYSSVGNGILEATKLARAAIAKATTPTAK